MDKTSLVLLTYTEIIKRINILLEYGNDFVFDTSMGGRQTQFSTLHNFTILPAKPFQGIDEIVPLSMLNELGLLGLISYYIAFGVPIILAFNRQNKPIWQKGLIVGMVTYLFVSISDGAFLLIPTLALFFFISSISHRHVQDKLRAKAATQCKAALHSNA